MNVDEDFASDMDLVNTITGGDAHLKSGSADILALYAVSRYVAEKSRSAEPFNFGKES